MGIHQTPGHYGDYRDIAFRKGEDVVLYEEYGSYQGDFVLCTQRDGVISIYKDYYGSCTGCDIYQGMFDKGYNDENIKEFLDQYTPFLTRKISEITLKDIEDAITINNSIDRDFTNEDQDKLIADIRQFVQDFNSKK